MNDFTINQTDLKILVEILNLIFEKKERDSKTNIRRKTQSAGPIETLGHENLCLYLLLDIGLSKQNHQQLKSELKNWFNNCPATEAVIKNSWAKHNNDQEFLEELWRLANSFGLLQPKT